MRYCGIGLALAVLASTPVAVAAPPPSPTAVPAGSLGIQLLGAPAAPRSDPLARVYIVGQLAPGKSVSRQIEVSNSTSSIAEVAVYPAAAGIHHGNFVFAAGDHANELSRWTSVSRSSLRIEPGGSSLETVTVRAPKLASTGERFAVVWAQISSRARGAGGVTLVSRVGVRIYISVGRGGIAAPSFAIGALRAARTAAGRPLILATVLNSGQRTVALSGTATLSHGPGGLRAGPFPVTVGLVLPPKSSAPVMVALERGLPRGPWRVQLRLRSGQIQRTAEATITFPRAERPSAPAPAALRATHSRSGLLIYLASALLMLLVVAGSSFMFTRHRPFRSRGRP